MRYRARMFRSGNWRQELKALLALAGPLIVNNLAIAGIHFADAVMAGRLGAESLAAVAIGGSIWFFGFTIGLGILMAIVRYDFRDIDRLAMVGDKAWEKGMAAFCKPFTSAKIRYFDMSDAAAAEAWIQEEG